LEFVFERKIDPELQQMHDIDKVCIKFLLEQWLFIYSSFFQSPLSSSIINGITIDLCEIRRMLKIETGS
jgi:hypothetical protein